MADGSTVMQVNGEQHQLNFSYSHWDAMPYEVWNYLEVNEQTGVKSDPGVNQTAVSLQDVTLTFSDLPAEAKLIVIGFKLNLAETEWVTQSYPVADGGVTIPLDTAALASSFDGTHFSVWFKSIGGENGAGVSGEAQLELAGNVPGAAQAKQRTSLTTTWNGHRVSWRTIVRFGVNPPPTPTPLAMPLETTCSPLPCDGEWYNCACWYLGAANQSCDDVCATHGNANAAATISVGSGGTEVACKAVLDALSAPGLFVSGGTWSKGVGCVYDSSYPKRVRYSSPATNMTDKDPTVTRACACNN